MILRQILKTKSQTRRSGVLLPGHAFDYKYRLSSEWKSYEGLDLAEQINKARKSPVSPSMVELVRSCLCCDKSQRPSAKEVVGRLEGSYEWLREADRSSELAAWLRADFRLDTGKRDAELKRYILDNMAETSGRQLKLMGSLFKDRYDTRTIVDRIHERMVEVGIPSNVASRPSSPLGLHTPSPRTTLPAPSKRSRMPSSGKEEEASAVATTATVSLASATTVSLAYATTVPSASATTTECRQPVRIFGVGLRQREDCKRIASSYGDKKRVREEEEEENREETVWDLLAGSDDDMIDFD
jgi:serine/threonine protein kinase